MENFNKVMDYFRRLHRGVNRISLVVDDNFYWLIEGYTVHKVPKKQMELNPAIFNEFAGDFKKILCDAEAGVSLKNTGLIRQKCSEDAIIPFLAETEKPFTAWFKKTLLDTFDPGFTLKSSGPISAAAVQYAGETAGIILPVRCPDIDIKPFL